MVKRKAGSESEKASNKKLKAEGGLSLPSSSKLSFDSAEQCFLSLIYPTTVEEFFTKNWEKEPLFIERKDAKYYGEFLTKANLEDIVKKEKLEYEEDVFVTRYSQKEKGLIQAEGRATAKSIEKYFKDEKATIVLSRPHRFHKELHHLFHLLESYFGCCGYSRVEVAPEDSQGHPPCYTCKEEFILQVEGKKHYYLYKPLKELANEDSDDLDEYEIGEVLHEYELEPGDLLYFPRGTVFQATSSSHKHSTHLSVQLYDENNWGHFLSTILDKAVTDALEKDVSFREGLPLNFLSYMGYEKKELSGEAVDTSGKIETSQKEKAMVPKLDKSLLEKQKIFQEKLKLKLISLAQYLDPHRGADCLGKWFIRNRLPPFIQSNIKPHGEVADQPPEDDNLVQMTFPEHVRIVVSELGDDWDDEDEEEDGDEEEDEDEEEEDASEAEEDENNNKDKDTGAKSEKKKDKGSNAKNGAEKNSKRFDLRSKVKTKKETKEEEDEAMEEDDKSMDLDGKFEDESCVLVHHSLHNGSDDSTDKGPGFIKFPLHYYDALLILHRTLMPVAVKDLPLSGEERVELAVTLWTEGLLEVKEP